ncbi:MAG: GNAT family N-acetyltransferase [Oscillospiraceae bacterium]
METSIKKVRDTREPLLKSFHGTLSNGSSGVGNDGFSFDQRYPRDIYEYMKKLTFPYNYETEYKAWESAFLYDIDGSGRTLFSDLETITAYSDGKLTGFVQYGRSAFGFDSSGDISDAVSYPIIRSFYFSEEHPEVGNSLINEAVNALSEISSDRIYAFFHYFGMSCYARHGKLSEKFAYIHELLLQNGFAEEHENVFYSSVLSSEKSSEVVLDRHEKTAGDQQYCDFIIDGTIVGGCELHFLEQSNTAYLRWIFVNDELRRKGIGSKCMDALKTYLFSKGFTRFDTDTALANKTAQHFYEKNGFVNEGITRSYFKDI